MSLLGHCVNCSLLSNRDFERQVNALERRSSVESQTPSNTMVALWKHCSVLLTVVFQSVYSANVSLNSNINQANRRTASVAKESSTHSPLLQIQSPHFLGCHQRSICGSPENAFTRQQQQQPGVAKNCFCDDQCVIYDDCCDDRRTSSAAAVTSSAGDRSLRSYVSCQRLINSDQGSNTSEVYVITRCDVNYEDSYVRERCEKPNTIPTSASSDGDRFYRLPVRGRPPFHLLYRNVYCALCSGDREFIFWSAVLRCGASMPYTTGAVNGSNLLRNFVHGSPACSTSFVPSRESLMRPAPRQCRVSIGRCDRSWTDRTIARRCRERTDFVFAGTRTFRNRECAICNYVNETYIRCEENKTPSSSSPSQETESNIKIVMEEESVVYSVALDFNRRRASISFFSRDTHGRQREEETIIVFPECPEGKVYDPFADQCRLISCRHGYSRREELCVQDSKDSSSAASVNLDLLSHRRPKMEENYDEDRDEYLVNIPDVTSEWPLTATITNRQCALLTVNTTNVLRLDNGSAYIASLHRIFSSDQLSWQGGQVHVCIPEAHEDQGINHVDRMSLSPRYNFTMFQFERWQRSLSLVGGVVCLVAIFIQLLIYAMFTSLWATTDGKSVVCLSLSLFLAQLLYLFAVLVWEELPLPIVCFVVCEAMQYFFIASFCWLNVVTIDVFRWLKSSDSSSSTYSYIAEECCTRFVWYSIYAWTVPLIVVTGSVATVILRIDGWHPYEDRLGGCWTMGLSQLMLFVLPICLLLTVNAILFVVAVCKFCFEPFPGRFEHQRNKYKQRCIVSLQLTVLMGMTWMFAVVAAVTKTTFLWNLFIVFDALQGLFLCSAFVCTRKVWRLFCAKSRIRRLSDGSSGRSSGNKFRSKTRKTSPLKSRNRIIMLETSI